MEFCFRSTHSQQCEDEDPMVLEWLISGRTIYHTLLVFNVLSTFKHYFTQNIMLSRVNTYNFHSNVKEIKKISVNQLFRQRVMASVIFTHGDNPKLLSDHVLTIFRRCDFLSKYSFKLYYFNYFEML